MDISAVRWQNSASPFYKKGICIDEKKNRHKDSISVKNPWTYCVLSSDGWFLDYHQYENTLRVQQFTKLKKNVLINDYISLHAIKNGAFAFSYHEIELHTLNTDITFRYFRTINLLLHKRGLEKSTKSWKSSPHKFIVHSPLTNSQSSLDELISALFNR